MTVKKALLIGFSLALTFIIATLVIGHLWAFIILIITAFIGIGIMTKSESKEDNSNRIE